MDWADLMDLMDCLGGIVGLDEMYGWLEWI